MKLNRRQLIAAAAAIGAISIAAGGGWLLLRDDTPKGASDRVDLLAAAYNGLPQQSDPVLYTMLSITGGMPTGTPLELRFFDLDAQPMSDVSEISASITNLVTGESAESVDVLQQSDGSWRLQQTTLQSNGWWQVIVSFDDLAASWTFLMPDPNLTGFGTPPKVDTQPDAQAMLAATLNTLTNRISLRWWEWLSGGNGAIILARYSVTTPESNGLPAAFESDSILAGRISLDGSAPSFRADNPRTVSVEDEQAWRTINGGTPETTTNIRYQPIEEYDETYAAYEGVHFGIIVEIEGRSCQLVAFYVPGHIDAWFAFWIDTETLFLRELFMLSVNHYMHWVYDDIDEPFELTI